jgi:hypothetical protein
MSVFDPKQILALAPQISAPDLERTFTRAVKEKNSGLAQLPVSEGVVSPQDNYRTNDRNYHAVDIEARYSCGTQRLNSTPPTIAPTTPSAMSSIKPCPCLLTILLPMNPAMRRA